jgi:ABC-type multidrug transport system ATPase subunit
LSADFDFLVEPLLRERIWNHLVDLTLTKKTTVLLSTHYIEETRQSDRIGLMRNGVLVAEDSPQIIMGKLDTNSLEEAFLKLSVNQESSGEIVTSVGDIGLQMLDCKPSTSNKTDQESKKTKKRRPKIMRALLVKNFVEVVRNFM